MSDRADAMTIVDNPARRRFEAKVGDDVAVVDYQRRGDAIIFIHTEVPDAQRGLGVGEALARTALDSARARNLSVGRRTRCWELARPTRAC